MAQCQFASKYYDYESRVKDAEFKCKEEALDTGLCIFHDSNYLEDKNNFSERRQQVIKGLMNKVKNSIKSGKALFCIGYYLPHIKINVVFTKPVYFDQAQFKEMADFSESTFSCEPSFYKANFLDKSSFYWTVFKAEVDFSGAIFVAWASFYNAIFRRAKASFSWTKFAAEVDFSWAIFTAEVDFTWTTFSAPTSFSMTTFSKKADFYTATFSSRTYFSGIPNTKTCFNAETYFNYVTFEDPTRVIFDVGDMSKVSFIYSDITRVRFSDQSLIIELPTIII